MIIKKGKLIKLELYENEIELLQKSLCFEAELLDIILGKRKARTLNKSITLTALIGKICIQMENQTEGNLHKEIQNARKIYKKDN